MRSLTTKSAVLGALLVLLATGSARAATMDVKVPFPFVVQGRTLPAGEYRVSSEAGVVALRGEHGNRANLYMLAMPANGHDLAGDKPSLTFMRYERQYRLTDVWQSGSEGLEPIHR